MLKTLPALQSSRDGIRFDIFGCLPCNSVEVRVSPEGRSAPEDELSDLTMSDIVWTEAKISKCLALSDASLCWKKINNRTFGKLC